MRVLVAGSRSYSDVDAVEWRLEELRGECTEAGGTLTVVEGGARGVDSIAGRWAARTPGVSHVQVAADWVRCGPDCPPSDAHRRRYRKSRDLPDLIAQDYCPRAGGRRNQAMLDDHGPIDLLLAFVDKPLPRSKGTADMVSRAIRAGVPYELREPDSALLLPLDLPALVTPVVERPGPRYVDDVDVQGGRL